MSAADQNLSPVTKDGYKTFITLDGDTKRLCEWAKLYDISVETIIGRVKDGWDWEVAIYTPTRKYTRRRASNDES